MASWNSPGSAASKVATTLIITLTRPHPTLRQCFLGLVDILVVFAFQIVRVFDGFSGTNHHPEDCVQAGDEQVFSNSKSCIVYFLSPKDENIVHAMWLFKSIEWKILLFLLYRLKLIDTWIIFWKSKKCTAGIEQDFFRDSYIFQKFFGKAHNIWLKMEKKMNLYFTSAVCTNSESIN